jgi:hypothetical protein
MEEPQIVSQVKYAEMIGCNVVIIFRAIKEGKIPPDAVTINPVNKYKSINVALADAAWGSNYRETRRKMNKSVLRKQEQNQSLKENIEAPAAIQVNASQEQAVEMPELGAKTSYSEADRQKKIYEAQLLQLKIEEEKGSLVKIDVIENAFFEHVRIVRDNIISLPDRIIDQIVSAISRNEAHLILQKEIDNVLESISRIPEWRNE